MEDAKGVVYFTSYQPANSACENSGNGRIYAMNYENAGAVYNTKAQEGDNAGAENYGDLVGRAKFFEGVQGVPSALTVRYKDQGFVQLMASMGAMTAGPHWGDKQGLTPWDPNPPLKIYYWRDSNSRSPEPLYPEADND